jgi:ubiquinone/menaquinone biosynthesis C-methylase UbiE
VRRRLRALLSRLHLLQALTATGDIVVLIGADVELVATVATQVGPGGEVMVVDPSVDLLERLRTAVSAPAVWYLVGEADVLPLPDESVDSLRSLRPTTSGAAAEWFRVLRRPGEVRSAGFEDSALNFGERVLSEAGFIDVTVVREDGAPSLAATKA